MGVADADGAVASLVLSVVWAYPLVLLVAVTMTWVSRSRRSPRAPRVWNLLPAPWVLACGGLLLYALLF
jgi:cytochrome c-type biogenesis protein CcmH/NrfF